METLRFSDEIKVPLVVLFIGFGAFTPFKYLVIEFFGNFSSDFSVLFFLLKGSFERSSLKTVTTLFRSSERTGDECNVGDLLLLHSRDKI